MTQTQTISISPRFFLNERKNYSDWPFGFNRELFQNAVDAHASKIEINIQHNPDNTCWFDFQDDGDGMSLDVLRNVYFSLGETTKEDEDSIGGFGKARILTCFSQKQYEIWSSNWYAVGSGSEYSVHPDQDEYINGCRLRILVDTSNYYSHHDMYECLMRYLSYSQMSCQVIVNGEEYNDWCHKRNLVRQLSFGDVHANKSGGKHPGLMIVRVSGVPMFTQYIKSEAQVVVEIDSKRSREVLVSNRDSLVHDCRNELDAFVQEIAVDKKSALRNNSRKQIFLGSTPYVTRRKKSKDEEQTDEVGTSSETSSGEMKFVIKMDPANAGADRSAKVPQDNNESEVDKETEIDEIIQTALIVCETENEAIRKVFPSYDPRNWKEMEWDGRPGKPYLKGRVKRDILRLWTVMLDCCLESWLEKIKLDEISWRPGFIFSDEAKAEKCSMGDGVINFLLNPVDSDGKLIYRLRSKEDWAIMLAEAVHEVVHLGYSQHDESWASAATEMFAEIMGRQKQIFQRLKKTLDKK